MNINIPDDVNCIINKLEEHGYEAYAVGGCVRDILMGRSPKDWDVCTSALPEQMTEVFKGKRIIETGLKHGTITLMIDKNPYEITTYRVDGKYSDNRRPDNVKFVNVLKRDLARRDFTINAMAFNPKTGLVDYYNGQQDLINKKIKCVGNPDKRFREDALRIMRAIRFASELEFTIETDTLESIYNNQPLLRNIAAERTAIEINKLLLGNKPGTTMFQYYRVLGEIIPEILPMVGFEQNTPYHCYDVFTHSLQSVDNSPTDIKIRLTMLFHDIGKPHCYTEDENGVGHFYGHPAISVKLAEKILKRLKYDNDTIQTVSELILYHDADIRASHKNIRKWLNRIGEERYRQLLQVKTADCMAQTYDLREKRRTDIENIIFELDEVIAQQQCFSLKNLAVNGRDLVSSGIPEGVIIGKILNKLLDLVINEEVENNKDQLIDKIKNSPF